MRQRRLGLAATALIAMSLPLTGCGAAGNTTAGPSGTSTKTTAPPTWAPKNTVNAYPAQAGTDDQCVVTGNGSQISPRTLAASVGSHGKKVHDVVADELRRYQPKSTAGQTTLGAIIIIADSFAAGDGSGVVPNIAPQPWLVGSEQISVGAKAIEIIDMNIDSYSPDVLTNHLTTLTGNLPVRKVVLNMSFEFLPCQYLEGAAFPEPDPTKVQEARYKQALANAQDWRDLQALKNYLGTAAKVAEQSVASSHSDAKNFATFLSERSGWLVPVAAAGNGVGDINNLVVFPFPTAPGLWPGVVSASAFDPANGTPVSGQTAAYSNSGEVMLSGNYLSAVGGVTPAGTSFAAPRLSALEAIHYLNATSTVCTGHITPNAPPPPLNYMGDIEGAVHHWDNLLVADAATAYCSGFPQ
jgi:hypothetical protein